MTNIRLLDLFLTVLDDNNLAPIMADWLEDNRSNYPSVDFYIKKLRNPTMLCMSHLCQVLCHYGTREERKMIQTALRKVKEKRHINWFSSKKPINTYLKRRVCFGFFASDIRSEIQNLVTGCTQPRIEYP